MRGGCRRARRLDVAYRRSAAGGRAEEIQRGRRKSSSKPRVKPMQSAERRRCNQRENTSDTARDWELAKVGAPAGGKPERLSSSGKADWMHEMRCIKINTLRRYCILYSVKSSCDTAYHIYVPSGHFGLPVVRAISLSDKICIFFVR